MGRPIKDLTGQRFGRLIAIRCTGTNARGDALWLCKCDCGAEKVIERGNLGRGIISCGCQREANRGKNWLTHGGSHTRLHRIWGGMMTRCNNPNAHEYENYGGRGITVCDEWHSFENFQAWAIENGFEEDSSKKNCTLDRIDVNGNYEPSNCRFISMKAQSRNRRSNRLITYKGETHCIAEWAEMAGIPYGTFIKRIYRGWSMEQALAN